MLQQPVTQPYWLETKMAEGYFNVADQQQIGQPDIDPAYLCLNLVLNIDGARFNFSKPVKFRLLILYGVSYMNHWLLCRPSPLNFSSKFF